MYWLRSISEMTTAFFDFSGEMFASASGDWTYIAGRGEDSQLGVAVGHVAVKPPVRRLCRNEPNSGPTDDKSWEERSPRRIVTGVTKRTSPPRVSNYLGLPGQIKNP